VSARIVTEVPKSRAGITLHYTYAELGIHAPPARNGPGRRQPGIPLAHRPVRGRDQSRVRSPARGAALALAGLVPFLAVGNTITNYSPEPLTEFAKQPANPGGGGLGSAFPDAATAAP
jgi:hypothetical protein